MCFLIRPVPGTPAAPSVLGAPRAASALPGGEAGTHQFRNEEHIWESRQDGQATGQRAGGSCRGHRDPLLQ